MMSNSGTAAWIVNTDGEVSVFTVIDIWIDQYTWNSPLSPSSTSHSLTCAPHATVRMDDDVVGCLDAVAGSISILHQESSGPVTITAIPPNSHDLTVWADNKNKMYAAVISGTSTTAQVTVYTIKNSKIDSVALSGEVGHRHIVNHDDTLVTAGHSSFDVFSCDGGACTKVYSVMHGGATVTRVATYGGSVGLILGNGTAGIWSPTPDGDAFVVSGTALVPTTTPVAFTVAPGSVVGATDWIFMSATEDGLFITAKANTTSGEPDTKQCRPGMYRPADSHSNDDCIPAPAGTKALPSNDEPIPCHNGTYQPAMGQNKCIKCPMLLSTANDGQPHTGCLGAISQATRDAFSATSRLILDTAAIPNPVAPHAAIQVKTATLAGHPTRLVVAGGKMVAVPVLTADSLDAGNHQLNITFVDNTTESIKLVTPEKIVIPEVMPCIIGSEIRGSVMSNICPAFMTIDSTVLPLDAVLVTDTKTTCLSEPKATITATEVVEHYAPSVVVDDVHSKELCIVSPKAVFSASPAFTITVNKIPQILLDKPGELCIDLTALNLTEVRGSPNPTGDTPTPTPSPTHMVQGDAMPTIPLEVVAALDGKPFLTTIINQTPADSPGINLAFLSIPFIVVPLIVATPCLCGALIVSFVAMYVLRYLKHHNKMTIPIIMTSSAKTRLFSWRTADTCPERFIPTRPPPPRAPDDPPPLTPPPNIGPVELVQTDSGTGSESMGTSSIPTVMGEDLESTRRMEDLPTLIIDSSISHMSCTESVSDISHTATQSQLLMLPNTPMGAAIHSPHPHPAAPAPLPGPRHYRLPDAFDLVSPSIIAEASVAMNFSNARIHRMLAAGQDPLASSCTFSDGASYYDSDLTPTSADMSSDAMTGSPVGSASRTTGSLRDGWSMGSASGSMAPSLKSFPGNLASEPSCGSEGDLAGRGYAF